MKINVVNNKTVASCLLTLFLGLSACSQTTSPTANEDKTNNATKNDGLPKDSPTYLVALEVYPPYTLRNERGYVEGYDADILETIGKKQGFRVKLLSRQWEGIFKTLDDNSRHIVASGAILNDERKKKWGYTYPYSSLKMAVFVPESNDINVLPDMAGKTIAVQIDSAMSTALEEFREKQPFDFKIEQYDSVYLAMKATAQGKADAFWATDKVGKYFMQKAPKTFFKEEFRIIDSGDEEKPIVFLLRRDNQELIEQINAGLEKIKQSGEFDAINKKWFGDFE